MTTFHSKTMQQKPNVMLFSPALTQAKQLQRRQTLRIWVGRILFFICLMLLWQFASGKLLNSLFLSSPLAIANKLGAWISDGTLWFHTVITLQETLAGLFFGVISGVLVGFLFGIQQMLAKILEPFIMAFYSIPKVALAPLFILWFGIEIQMKIILAAVIVFFLVFLNTLTGVRNVDQNLVDAVRLMGANRRDIIFKVILPSATGYMLAGLRLAIPYALMGAVIAELIASNRGIGYLIYSSENVFDITGVFAALFVLTIIAVMLNAVVSFIDRNTSRWKVNMSMDRKVIP